MLSRREFLARAGALLLAPTSPTGAARDLQRALDDLTAGWDMAVMVRRLAGPSLTVAYEASVNATLLRPIASCFKAWAAYYAFYHTPLGAWNPAPGTDLHSMVVFSNNVATGNVIRDVGAYVRFGNALQKFNDFTTDYGLGLRHGLYNWGWPRNPLIDTFDDRFAPGPGRLVTIRDGTQHTIDNVTTAADLVDGYTRLLRIARTPGFSREKAAADATLRLLALDAGEAYQSVFERGIGAYTGKDGVLPTDSVSTGRVLNDAGYFEAENGAIVAAFLAVGESESLVVETVAGIGEAIAEIEAR